MRRRKSSKVRGRERRKRVAFYRLLGAWLELEAGLRSLAEEEGATGLFQAAEEGRFSGAFTELGKRMRRAGF